MSTQLKKAPKQRAYVPIALIALLVAVGLLALVEKGPATSGIPVGASPLNPMALGTSQLVDLAARNYSTAIIYSLKELEKVSGELCVFVIISPEIPFRGDEAEIIISLLRQRCLKLKVLVADESPYSNPLLQVLKSSIRVNGNRVLEVSTAAPIMVVNESTYNYSLLSPYPLAEIMIRSSHAIVLDKASTVSGGLPIGYAYPRSESTILCLANPSGEIYECGTAFVVASKEVASGVDVFTIGDGSVLLNQVLSSNKSEYMAFARELLSHLCEDNLRCTVVFDAMHYTSLSPANLLSNLTYSLQELVRDPTTFIYVMLSLLAVLLHPSVWLPPLIQLLSSLLTTILTGFASAILIFFFTLVIHRILMRDARTFHDLKLSEQAEEEVGVFAEIKKSVISGKAKLSKQDFAILCQTLDALLVLYSGSGLWSERSLGTLAELLGDRRRAYKKLQWVLKLHRKAIGKSRLPLFVFWGRAVKKLVSLIDEVGERIGERMGVNLI
jgi:hypothetical protein